MDPTLLALFLFAIFMVCLAAFMVWAIRNSRAAKLRRAMRETPRTAISAVRSGTIVKLVGRVRLAGEPLRAPLTGRSCTYFHAFVQRRELFEEDDAFGRTTLGKRWVTIRHDVDRRPFSLEDETGTALVNLDTPEVLILRAWTEVTGLLAAPSAGLAEYLAAHGLPHSRFKALRVEERALLEGDEVAVLGWATREAGGGVGEPVTRVVVSGTVEVPLRVATTDAIGG